MTGILFQYSATTFDYYPEHQLATFKPEVMERTLAGEAVILVFKQDIPMNSVRYYSMDNNRWPNGCSL